MGFLFVAVRIDTMDVVDAIVVLMAASIPLTALVLSTNLWKEVETD
jgi:hypothetical protein